MSPVRMKHRSRPTANTIFARCGVKVCAIKRVRTATDRSDPRTIVTQPSTQRQLTDAERIAILDRKIASLEALGHTLVNREPFCAIINVRWKIKKSDILIAILATVFTFGVGLILWGIYILALVVNNHPYHRVEVTPSGKIVRTKLKANDPQLPSIVRGS